MAQFFPLKKIHKYAHTILRELKAHLQEEKVELMDMK